MIRKLIALAALPLTIAACSKSETEEQQQPVESKGITLTATLAPKGPPPTKALADHGDGKLTASWAVGETLAIAYNLSKDDYLAVASVVSVDASGAATIEFTVDPSTPDGTDCDILYPSTSLIQSTIAFQSGELSTVPDVRYGRGVISPATPDAGLTLTMPLTPLGSIFKFTLQDEAGAAIMAKTLVVAVNTDTFVATPSAATSEYYLFLPAISGEAMTISVPGDKGTSSYRFFRADVTFEAGKYYRSTLKMTLQSEAADYVAMGDGLNWAVRNVGADKPEDYGDYFAWGEVEPYYRAGHAYDEEITGTANWKDGKADGYSWPSYQWGDGSTFSKYTGSEDSVLQPADDAATQNMGSGWRMPTQEEWKGLLSEFSFYWVWVKDFNGSGTNGSLVISRKAGYEGNSIFLPAAGHREGRNLSMAGINGYYWSSSLDTEYPDKACSAYFQSEYPSWRYSDRSFGHSVRGIRKAE